MVKLVFDFIAYASELFGYEVFRTNGIRRIVKSDMKPVLYIASGCRTALICASAYKKTSARVRRFLLYVVLSRIISSG